jgi:hypothetical protein
MIRGAAIEKTIGKDKAVEFEVWENSKKGKLPLTKD